MKTYSSRLNRLEDKRNTRKAFLIVLGTIVIVILMLVIGIPTLIRMVVLIGDMKSSGKQVDRMDVIPPSPPQILYQYDATNSAQINLTGFSEAGATVYLTNNSNSIGEAVVKDDGTWLIANIKLNTGSNDFIATAVDLSGNRSQMSKTVSIIFSTKEPKLEISSPTDRQNVTGKPANVNVRGLTDPDARLTVNDRVIIVSADGTFSANYPLNSGENVMIFLSKDIAGNQARREMTVTYQP